MMKDMWAGNRTQSTNALPRHMAWVSLGADLWVIVTMIQGYLPLPTSMARRVTVWSVRGQAPRTRSSLVSSTLGSHRHLSQVNGCRPWAPKQTAAADNIWQSCWLKVLRLLYIYCINSLFWPIRCFMWLEHW